MLFPIVVILSTLMFNKGPRNQPIYMLYSYIYAVTEHLKSHLKTFGTNLKYLELK